MAADATPPEGPRYTVMIVPSGGRGEVHQVELNAAQIRATAAGLAAALLCALVGLGSLLGAGPVWGVGALAEENLSMRARLRDLEQTVTEAEAELERVRLQQARLSILSGQGGYGPLDAEEMVLLGAEAVRGRLERAGEAGEPMEEVEEVGQRARLLLLALQETAPEMERLIATEWARRDTIPSTWPTAGVLTSGFGMRRSPINRRWKFHGGLDIGAERGTPVVATAAGQVVHAEYVGAYGNLVEIDHGDGVVTRYGHNARLLVAAGDDVLRGDVIATVGSTGQSTGPHLHYEVHLDGEPVDPLEYIQE